MQEVFEESGEMKPLLYDICCCAGGATKGYQNAGFRVIGIDNKPQPHYIGDGFILMDCLEFLDRYLAGEFERADAFHASPPCQNYTLASRTWKAKGYQYSDLIEPIRQRLKLTGKPHVIENVPNSPLINPIKLNGAMFGMLICRDRLFETSFEMPMVLLPQNRKSVKMGRPVKEGDVICPVGHFPQRKYAEKQMGIDWMSKNELTQAIPSAYTEFIGKYLMQQIKAGMPKNTQFKQEVS